MCSLYARSCINNVNQESYNDTATRAFWVRELNLKEDKLLIQAGDWLNDYILDAVNTTVARHIGGDANQSILIAQSQEGLIACSTKESGYCMTLITG